MPLVMLFWSITPLTWKMTNLSCSSGLRFEPKLMAAKNLKAMTTTMKRDNANKI